ncbi:MAG: hypothetical protein ACTSUB_00995 [Candidatus Thorarchaeota archaeon]
MKIKLKIDSQWLEVERQSMSKMQKDYEAWQSKTLKKAREAKDLRDLREVFYQLGDRWEWDQTTGAWLSSGEPLDTIGLILRLPGFHPTKERYVVYGIMAYSKGLTDQFDHLGDKERIIIEHDTQNNQFMCWSTTGHGAMDQIPTDLRLFTSLEEILDVCHVVAQPGDHAMRLEIPRQKRARYDIAQRLWEIANGNTSYITKEIDVLTSAEIEDKFDFKFYRYAQAVVELERIWKDHTIGSLAQAKEKIVDKIPTHLESRNKNALRKVEGLMHILWFKPPIAGLKPARRLYEEIKSEPTPTMIEKTLSPYLGELVYSLNDIIEKAKYLKWKSVMDKASFTGSGMFKDLEITNLAKEAFAVALDDILKEHTLAYIGYPERGTIKGKLLRITFSLVILPLRLAKSFYIKIKSKIMGLFDRKEKTDAEKIKSDESLQEEET